MITLNINKGLIRVADWGDIEARIGFIKDLNPKNHKLSAIIGRYVLGDKIPCGLSNCHSPHSKGYIVATADGHETNIGQDCGRTYFGVDFETLSKQFDRDITDMENREELWNFSIHLPQVEDRIKALRNAPRGADWLYKRKREITELNQGCPEKIVKRMNRMIKDRSGLLVSTREATEKEIQDLEGLQGKHVKRPHYIEEPVAQIAGLEIFYPENDLRGVLVFDLGEKISNFKAQPIDQMTSATLKQWAKWSRSTEDKLALCQKMIDLAPTFFNTGNLKPFQFLLETPEETTQFSEYLKSLSTQ